MFNAYYGITSFCRLLNIATENKWFFPRFPLIAESNFYSCHRHYCTSYISDDLVEFYDDYFWRNILQLGDIVGDLARYSVTMHDIWNENKCSRKHRKTLTLIIAKIISEVSQKHRRNLAESRLQKVCTREFSVSLEMVTSEFS